MKSPAKIVVWLLPFFLTACVHRKPQAVVQPPLVPVIVDSQPPPPPTNSVNLPPQQASIPSEPVRTAPTPPAKSPSRHHRSADKNNPVNNAPQEAAVPAPSPGVSAIGELSSGDPANYRQATEDSIASTERGLNGINRPLNDSEQKTADQIRDFLKQAKAALESGDVDGAHTLAAKAKVLLAELTQ